MRSNSFTTYAAIDGDLPVNMYSLEIHPTLSGSVASNILTSMKMEDEPDAFDIVEHDKKLTGKAPFKY